MIELSESAAVWVVGAAVLAVMAWGTWTSVRGAIAGPAWALSFLRSSRLAWTVAAVFGVITAVAARPAWVGLAVGYTCGVAAGLAWLFSRSLGRLAESEGFIQIPLDDRVRTIRRVRNGLAGLAVVAGVVPLAESLRSDVTFVLGGFALLMAVGAVALARVRLTDGPVQAGD